MQGFVHVQSHMYWVAAHATILVVILITTGGIDIDVLMMPTVGATNRLVDESHIYAPIKPTALRPPSTAITCPEI